MKLSRKAIQRMVDSGQVNIGGRRTGSGGGGGGGVSATWVEENYISKAFFNTLFTIHGHDADDTAVPPTDVIIEPNDTETVPDSIEAMVGLWTEKYLSALGLSSGGGGGGDVLAEPLMSINGIGSPTAANQTLVWDGTRWTFKPYGQGGGSVTSIRITVPTGFAVSPSTITTAGTFAITFASGYSLPTTAKQTNWDNAYTWVNTNGQTVLTNSHTHSNKSVLDGITSTKVSNWDTAYTWVNANGASTVSKTAWGRTYWNAGAPANIDGDMTSVGNISFSASGKNIGGVAYFDTTNSRLGIGTTSPSTSLHVVGRVTCQYDSTKKGSFCATRGDYATYYGIDGSGFAIITTGQSSSSSSTVRISMTPYNAPEQYILFGASSSIKMGTTISNNTETYRDGAYIQIGGARIVWDSTNNALKVIKSDGTSAANFYATGAVSALGANSESGGGVGDVTWSALASSSDTRQIAASHLSSVTQPLYFLFNDDANPTVTYDGKTNKAVGNILTKSYADGRYVKQSGNAIISGTATIGGNMTIGATEAVGTVNSQVIQTLNRRAIYIKTDSAPHYVDGTWSNTSDIRLKDIINNVGASVDQIANAPIFNYKWKSGGVSIMLGSSAQYWQNVFQHAVEIGPENYLYMDYSSVALASAVMVARKVVNHEERIRQLERENEELRKLLNIA
jgi:hypothetical protein